MKKTFFKKTLSFMLSTVIILSACAAAPVFAENGAETTAITQSPRVLLREQMRSVYNQVTETIGKAPGNGDALNSYVTVSQSGPWYVYGTAYNRENWSNTKGFYRRSDSTTSIDLRYGYSYWSYTTPSVRVSYKDGDSKCGEALTALLRPDSTTTDADRKNAYIGIYYEAEVSGEYYVSDNFGGFIVRESNAEGYNAYITIYANGKELYKSTALSRVNRFSEFGGLTVKLEKGEKLEYRFTYEPTADSYNGDIEFDFDPKITLLSEMAAIEGTGEIATKLYNALNLLEASGTNTSKKVTQTAVWRAQQYTGGSWKELTYYCTHSKSTDGGLDWGYDDGSYSQTDRLYIKYKNGNISEGLYICAKIPMNFEWTKKPLRLAYTAERDGTYYLKDKFGKFTVEYGALEVYDCRILITHNGEVIWNSEILANKGETAEFNGISTEMKTGDNLAIEFDFQKKEGATAVKDKTSIIFGFAPTVSYVAPATNAPIVYSAVEAHDALFKNIVPEDDTDTVKGALTQPDFGWAFKYGRAYDSLNKLEKYQKGSTTDNWASNLLLNPEAEDGQSPSVSRGTGKSAPDYGKLAVNLRSRMNGDGSGIRDGVYAYEYAYTFTAPYDGKYVLSKADFKLDGTSDIPGAILRIYKNGALAYSSATVCNDNTETVIPESTFVLSCGEELIFFFERQDTPDDKNFNHWMRLQYTPTVTYYGMSSSTEEKSSYEPVQSERRYTENMRFPVTVSAFVKLDNLLGGAIISSDVFTFDIANHGYPRITLSDKTEVVFPVDIRSNSFNHIAVSYDSGNDKWRLYLNGVSVSEIAETTDIKNAAEKLYVGASADKYNNACFKGSLAEVSLWSKQLSAEEISALAEDVNTSDSELLAYWPLTDGDKTDLSTNKRDLIAETVDYTSEKPENGLVFYNKNYRYDTYEVYQKPVNTVEVWVRLDKNYRADRSAGCIISAYYSASYADYMQLDVGMGGKPVLKLRVNGNAESFTFDTDLRTGSWLHLAVTADYGASAYNCYVDGTLVDSVKTGSLKIPITLRPYLISGQYFHNNTPINFEGELAGMKLYGDARTESEVLSDIYSTDLEDAELLSVWAMDGTKEGLADKKGTNDLHPFWADSAAVTVDEEFGNYSTFVIIPDTQNFTQGNGAEGLKKLSSWILENKESENIVGVMGLGDITNNNSVSQWTDAKNGFAELRGKIPFVFVSGNHDIEFKNPSEDNPRDVSCFNTAFPYADWEPYMSGFFEEGKIDNMYYLTEPVNGVKYMLMGLEFMPRDEVLEWAGRIIGEHPDYKVLIATHAYQTYSYISGENTYLSDDEYTEYKKILGENQNTGEQMWNKLVKNYANIQAVFCGHVYHEDVHATSNIGDNGNTVTEIIANAQTTDALMRSSGIVMLLRVSEDGAKANINFYSTYHNHYLKDLNQFNINWSTEKKVCRIGNDYYTTLEEAVSAAAADNTVTLLGDVVLAEALSLSESLKLDMAGHSVSVQDGGRLFKLVAGMGYSLVDGVYTIASSSVIADIDKNGTVGATDLSYFRRTILGIVNDGNIYDINGDSSIDILDFVRLKKLSAA